MMQLKQIYKDRIKKKTAELEDDSVKHFEKFLDDCGTGNFKRDYDTAFEDWVIQKIAAIEVILELAHEREQMRLNR